MSSVPLYQQQQPQQQQQQQQQQQLPFSLIVPGCPPRYDFTPIDPSGLKFGIRLSCPGDIPFPLASIKELVFFLNPTSTIGSIPNDHGILIYWQIASATNPEIASTGYELLGFVTHDSPSAVFHTGWGEHEQISALALPNSPPVIVTIGLSIESTLGNTSFAVAANNPITERRLYVAKQIASDLFRFMQSFDGSSSNNNNGQMIVPTNIFDRWYTRFENRFRRDPNFFLRSSE
jgi:protein Hikeshi